MKKTDTNKYDMCGTQGCTISDQSLKLKLQVLPSDFPNKKRPKTPNNPYPISKKPQAIATLFFGLF